MADQSIYQHATALFREGLQRYVKIVLVELKIILNKETEYGKKSDFLLPWHAITLIHASKLQTPWHRTNNSWKKPSNKKDRWSPVAAGKFRGLTPLLQGPNSVIHKTKYFAD